MKLRITLLFAVLLFGITFYSCSNDDESPEQEIVAEEENPGDSDENGDDGSDGDTEGDGDSDGEDTDGDSGSDGGSDDGGSNDEGNDGGNDEEGDTNDDGNGDSGEGNGDSGDNPEEEENTDDVGPVVNVTSPQEGQVFQEGDAVDVDTEITDDSNIVFARLFINGTLLRQENVAPYQWGSTNPSDTMLSNLAAGNYELRIDAEDEFGNLGQKTIAIVVEASMDEGDGGTGGEDTGGDNDQNGATSCNNPGDATFLEENGLVVVEFENNSFEGDWDFNTNEPNFSGNGYRVWSGPQSFSNPGNGLVQFKIQIQNPGTYRFVWRTAVTIGNNGTEHNDTWLRFDDADDFFGMRSNGSVVFPRDRGKTPNPNGSSKDGWFKVNRSGNDLGFKWEALTSDNDGHNIFVTFNSPGTYTMEVSARSSGHAIDKFVLFQEDNFSLNEATSSSNPLSEVNCN